MNSSIEFIAGQDANIKTVAVVSNGSPVGMNIGMEIEINHRTYRIDHIHVIVSHTYGSIVYQIRVTETA